MAEMPEFSGCRIAAVNSAAAGNHPQIPPSILVNRTDVICGNGGWIKRIVAEGGKAVAVVTIQTIRRANPQKTLAVLEKRGDMALEKPLFVGNAFKFEIALREEHGSGKEKKKGG
jgi:hypothetical protein